MKHPRACRTPGFSLPEIQVVGADNFGNVSLPDNEEGKDEKGCWKSSAVRSCSQVTFTPKLTTTL